MLTLRIEMLGPLQVRVGEETAVFRTDAERVLLAYLAAHQGRAQRRDTLAGLLSPDRPDQEALTYLRNRLARLRGVVRDDEASPPLLAIDRKQITLRNGDDIEVDVAQFERLLAAVESHPHRRLAGCPTCVAHLEEAVALVRGEFLAGLNFPSETWEAWLLAQREHVGQRALAAMTRLREVWWERGELTAVLTIAHRQIQLEPWLEAAHRAIMHAHAALGDRNAALAQFEQCQTVLWDELGIEPDTETTHLHETIQSVPLSPSFIIPNSSFLIPNNLPSPTDPFIGREAEQTQLLQRLVDPACRLLTVVGTGGIGKTRLAVEVGRQVQMSFPDGVWFMPLDAARGEAEQIKIGVGEALGLGQGGKQLTGEQVLAILRDKQLLLILDNCETVLDGLGFLAEWLRRAPQVAMLATSREPLNFQAESVVVLGGLPVGTAEALFAERGRMARGDFVVTAVNLPHIQQICQLVDGSPLGIGLAAAWVRRRSLPQIIAGIGQSLDFLATRLRDVDPRHRSVRAVFETSWQLLEPEVQGVLAALSVFPGSFTAVAAQNVADASLFDLDLLCEKSLLQQQHENERYSLHSLVRQFVAEKLGERVPIVARAFTDYFYQLVCEGRGDYGVLREEWGNVLTAVVKAHAHQWWPQTLALVQQLDEPWFRQIRFQDMRQGLALAMDAAEAVQDQLMLSRLRLRLAEIETELNDYVAAEQYLAAVMLPLFQGEDGWGIAQANYINGRIQTERGQSAEALMLLEESRRIFAEEDDGLGVAKNLNLIALCHITYTSDLQAAHTNLTHSVAVQSLLPPSTTYVEALRYLARVEGIWGNYAAAENHLAEALGISRAQQDIGEQAAVLFEQMVLCRRQNQWEAGLKHGYEALDLFQRLGSLRWEALVQAQLALLHQARHDFPQALLFFQAGLKIFEEVGDLYEQAYAHYHLFRLYADMGEVDKSVLFRQHAWRLNLQLQDAQLKTRLE
ncbi:MAG: BTAD domain-containing putative transcriptional regulator [Chloroflexota bacterium]